MFIYIYKYIEERKKIVVYGFKRVLISKGHGVWGYIA